MTTKRMVWADYDQSSLLSGNLLTGVGVEIASRAEMLDAQAEAKRLAGCPMAERVSRAWSARRRVGHTIVHLGIAVAGAEVHSVHEAPARAG